MNSKPQSLRPTLFDLLCLAAALAIIGLWFLKPRFNSDSWTYLELSNYIFTDFFRFNTFRQYESTSLYSTSYPPLYPTLLAISRQIYDVGIYTGIFLNTAVCLATLFVLKNIMHALNLPRWVGNLLFLALLFRPMYILELMAGRSIPLALLLILLVLRVYVSPQAFTPSRAALMGFLAGLAVMARFDLLAACMFLGLVVAWYAGRRVLIVSPVYYALLLLAISPWIAYSLTYFSKPFISDNSRTALLAMESHVINYYPEPDKLQYLWDAPVTWATSVFLVRLPWVLGSGFRTLTTDVTLIALAGTWLGILLATGAQRGTSSNSSSPPSTRANPHLLAFGAVFAVQIFTIGLTGFSDMRYFVPLQTFLSIFFAWSIGSKVDLAASIQQWPLRGRQALCLLFAAATVVLSSASVLSYVKSNIADLRAGKFQLLDPQLLSGEQYKDLLVALHRGEDHPRLLVLSGIDPFSFGALTGCETIFKPDNFTPEVFEPLVEDFSATHVLDTEDSVLSKLPPTVSLAPTEMPGLLRIIVARRQPAPVAPSSDKPSSDPPAHGGKVD